MGETPMAHPSVPAIRTVQRAVPHGRLPTGDCTFSARRLVCDHNFTGDHQGFH